MRELLIRVQLQESVDLDEVEQVVDRMLDDGVLQDQIVESFQQMRGVRIAVLDASVSQETA